jgi:hypothetical protein
LFRLRLTNRGHKLRSAASLLEACEIEQIPRVGRLENIEAIDRDTYALVRGYLEAHRDEIGVADLDAAAFVCVTAVEALTHAAVLRCPEMLGGEKAERFVDDVTRLIVRYLQKP